MYNNYYKIRSGISLDKALGYSLTLNEHASWKDEDFRAMVGKCVTAYNTTSLQGDLERNELKLFSIGKILEYDINVFFSKNVCYVKGIHYTPLYPFKSIEVLTVDNENKEFSKWQDFNNWLEENEKHAKVVTIHYARGYQGKQNEYDVIKGKNVKRQTQSRILQILSTFDDEAI